MQRRGVLAATWALVGCGSAEIFATPVPDPDWVWAISYKDDAKSVDLDCARDAASGTARASFNLGGRTFGVVVDAHDPAGPPQLRVEGAEPAVTTGEWQTATAGEPAKAFVDAEVEVELRNASGARWRYPVRLGFFGRSDGEGGLAVSGNVWRKGKVVLGGREFAFALRDRDLDGSYSNRDGLDLAFDRDGDGRLDADDDRFGELYAGDESFNLGTGTFRVRSVSPDGTRATFEPAFLGRRPRAFLGRGDPAPDLPATDLDGRPVSLADFRGRRLLLVFWSHW